VTGTLWPVGRFFFTPGDWISDHTSARLRRAIIFWALVVIVIAGIATYPARANIGVLWALSVFALILGCIVALFAETPVETEDE
jgi:hypothetical protein